MMDQEKQNVQIAERRAKWMWVSFVVLLLGLQLVIGGIAIRLAVTDRTAAVVPDYHQASLRWDEQKESRQLLKRLGWDLQLWFSDTVDGGGNRALHIDLTDKNGQAVDQLEVSLTAFHHARGRDIINAKLAGVGNGRYQCLAPLEKKGLWDFDFAFNINGHAARVARTVEVR